MALDPSISLPSAAVLQSIANPPNPLDAQAKLLALQNARLQSQTLQQQQQMGALDIQQKQREIQAQQVLSRAMQNAVTTGPDGTPVFNKQAISNYLAQSGRGDLIPSTMENLTKTDQAYATLADTRTKVQKAQQDFATANADAAGMAAFGVKQHGYDAPSAIGMIAYAAAHGQLDPAQANAATQQILANPTPQAVQAIIDPMIARSDKAQKAQTDAITAAARQQTAQTGATKTTAELPGIQAKSAQDEYAAALPTLQRAAGTPAYANAYQSLSPAAQKIAPAPATNPTPADVVRASMTGAQQTTAAYQQQEVGLRQRGLRIESAHLAVDRMNAGLDPATGQPIQYTDAQGNPTNVSPLAASIAAYKLPPATARSMTSAQGKNLMNQVLAVNPDFDIGQYEQRYQTMQDLRPGGKLGQQSLAINTLIRHSDDMMGAVEALKNGDLQALNTAKQNIAQWTGSSAPTNFDQWKQFVVGETVKAIRGAGGNLEDEKNAAGPLSKANSPQQLLDAMNINFAATGGKLQAINQAVRPIIRDPNFTALDPDAAAIMQKRGYDPQTLKPVAQTDTVRVISPQGQAGTIPKSKLQDALKRGFKQPPPQGQQ